MKTLNILFVIILSVLLLSAPLLANQAIDPVVKAKYKTIEANLLVGLNSDNEGLRISCAYFLGEMKSGKAVNHLMKILREDECYAARVVAALSLIKIDDPQGVYFVHRTSLFNDFDGVRKMSEKFYLSYLFKKYLENNPEKSAELAYIKF